MNKIISMLIFIRHELMKHFVGGSVVSGIGANAISMLCN